MDSAARNIALLMRPGSNLTRARLRFWTLTMRFWTGIAANYSANGTALNAVSARRSSPGSNNHRAAAYQLGGFWLVKLPGPLAGGAALVLLEVLVLAEPLTGTFDWTGGATPVGAGLTLGSSR